MRLLAQNTDRRAEHKLQWKGNTCCPTSCCIYFSPFGSFVFIVITLSLYIRVYQKKSIFFGTPLLNCTKSPVSSFYWGTKGSTHFKIQIQGQGHTDIQLIDYDITCLLRGSAGYQIVRLAVQTRCRRNPYHWSATGILASAPLGSRLFRSKSYRRGRIFAYRYNVKSFKVQCWSCIFIKRWLKNTWRDIAMKKTISHDNMHNRKKEVTCKIRFARIIGIVAWNWSKVFILKGKMQFICTRALLSHEVKLKLMNTWNTGWAATRRLL